MVSVIPNETHLLRISSGSRYYGIICLLGIGIYIQADFKSCPAIKIGVQATIARQDIERGGDYAVRKEKKTEKDIYA